MSGRRVDFLCTLFPTWCAAAAATADVIALEDELGGLLLQRLEVEAEEFLRRGGEGRLVYNR